MNRKSQQQNQPKVRRPLASLTIAIGLGILACGVVIAGIDYHGLTYDEPIYVSIGARSAEWVARLFTSLFDDTLKQHLSAPVIARAWFASKDMQPPLLQVLSGISNLLLGKHVGGLLAPRLPTALFFGLAIAVVFWLTERAFDRPAGVFAALGLLFLPAFFGHAHLSTLDVPVSALILLTAATFYAASEERSWSLALLSGLFLGLALLTKLNAAFLIGFLLLWTLLFHRPMLPRALVSFFIVPPLVFVAGWPWLWHSTLPHLKDYLGFHLQHYPVLVYYLGQLYQYAPWHYPFVVTAVTVPAMFLLLMLAGIGYALSGRSAYSGKKVKSSFRAAGWLLLICGVGYLLPSALPFTPKYNGSRLFLPAFPFLMALAGGGFTLIYELLYRRLEDVRSLKEIGGLRGKLALLVGLILLLPAVRGLSRVYPHELAYYNAFIGGPAGARAHGFETIYWGGVYNDALPALNAAAKNAPRVFITPQGVVSLLVTYQRGGALPPGLQWLSPPPPEQQKAGWPRPALEGVDLVVFQCAQSEFDELAWKLYREGRPAAGSVYLEGVPLLLIFSGDEARRLFAVKEAR